MRTVWYLSGPSPSAMTDLWLSSERERASCVAFLFVILYTPGSRDEDHRWKMSGLIYVSRGEGVMASATITVLCQRSA
jgi:gentisate 1,2-dioxygenase